MIKHSFGGNWTEAKLARLKAYLDAYRNIFTTNEGAKWFTSWYVDAFAGTGTRSISVTAAGSLGLEDSVDLVEVEQYFEGSAKIALSLSKPFDRYLFIEKSKHRVEALQALIAKQHPELLSRCFFMQDDANAALSKWSADRDWTKERAVVFLDPYGMQVHWQTVKMLGDTKGIDLWYLFSLSSVIRMLTRDGRIDASWQDRLDTVFGVTDWRDHFYKKSVQTGLFGELEVVRRDTTIKSILDFIEARLKTCFVTVAPSLALRNSKGFPLFALCFAASNEKGAKPAISIATHLLKED